MISEYATVTIGGVSFKPVQSFRFRVPDGAHGLDVIASEEAPTWFEAREKVRQRYQGCDVFPAERISHATGERLS